MLVKILQTSLDIFEKIVICVIYATLSTYFSVWMTVRYAGGNVYALRNRRNKSRLKLKNACYWSMQNLLSSSLLSRVLKLNKYRTIILPVVLYGCETWSLTLREERRLRVYENRVMRRVFGSKREEVTG
jgi:hypothetical protein